MWSDPVRYINDETSPVNRNTLALVATAAALEALAQPSLPDQEAMQLVHDMWCHPGNDKTEQISKARRGRGFPRSCSRGFITKLRKFLCATCAVSKRTRRYRRSKRVKVVAAKRVKVAAAKRAPQAHTLRKRTSEQEAQKQDSAFVLLLPSLAFVLLLRLLLVQLSSSCRAKDVSVFLGAHRSCKSSHIFLPLSQLF
jgi:hypothetical protein